MGGGGTHQQAACSQEEIHLPVDKNKVDRPSEVTEIRQVYSHMRSNVPVDYRQGRPAVRLSQNALVKLGQSSSQNHTCDHDQSHHACCLTNLLPLAAVPGMNVQTDTERNASLLGVGVLQVLGGKQQRAPKGSPH